MAMTAIAETRTETMGKQERVLTVLERSVCIMLTCGHLGIHRKVDPKSLKMEKDGEALSDDEQRVLSVTKRLVEADELRACERTIGAAKNYLQSVSVSGQRVFGDGTYLIPRGLLREALDRLEMFRGDLQKHVDALVARWPEIVETARTRQRKLFDASHFPTADDVRRAYRIDWNFLSFAAPDRLEEVDAALAADAERKAQERLSAAYDEIVVGMREAALRVMRELADRLKPGKDGKVKALRQTALDDLQDLLGRLPVLNITGDDALADALARMGATSTGLTVDTLKAAPAVRDMLLAEAERAAATLDGLVLSGRRAMNV